MVGQRLPPNKCTRNEVELQDDIPPSSFKNSVANLLVEVDAPICYANDVSKLERTLDRESNTTEYLQSTGELWKEECSRLRKKLNDKMIRAEGVYPPLLQTILSSVSRKADTN